MPIPAQPNNSPRRNARLSQRKCRRLIPWKIQVLSSSLSSLLMLSCTQQTGKPLNRERERERERELWDLRVWGVCVSWPLLPFVNNLYFVAIIAIASGVSNLAVVCGAFLLFLYWSITKTSKSENSLILAQDVSSRDSSFLDREVIPAI